MFDPQEQSEDARENDDNTKNTKHRRQARIRCCQQQHNPNTNPEGGHDVEGNRSKQRPPDFDDERGSDDANETNPNKEKTDSDTENLHRAPFRRPNA